MPSFGETLKRERELRRITLREISEATKINLRYLEALERDDFRHLPGGVFNKGFVRAYAQFIGVDGERMVDAYLLEEQRQQARQQQRVVEAQLRSTPPDGAEEASRSGRRLAAVLLILVLVVAAAVAFVTWKGFLAPGAWFRDRGTPASPGADPPRLEPSPAPDPAPSDGGPA